MKRRNLLIALTVATVAAGGVATLARLGHAQTLPTPTTQPAAAVNPATAPTVAAAAAATTNPASETSRGYGRDERRSSRTYGYGSTGASSAYPVQKLVGTQYAMLETHSMFYHGHFVAGRDPTDPLPPRNDPQPSTYATSAPAPERTLVFEGATEFDNDYVAFIEDQTSNRVLMLKAGDAVGRGRVGDISLNFMDYLDKAGKQVRVPIGKNLEGNDPPATQPSYSSYSSSPSYSSSTPSTSSAYPSSGSSASPSSSGGIMSPADMAAEKLRRRRQAELGGGG